MRIISIAMVLVCIIAGLAALVLGFVFGAVHTIVEGVVFLILGWALYNSDRREYTR